MVYVVEVWGISHSVSMADVAKTLETFFAKKVNDNFYIREFKHKNKSTKAYKEVSIFFQTKSDALYAQVTLDGFLYRMADGTSNKLKTRLTEGDDLEESKIMIYNKKGSGSDDSETECRPEYKTKKHRLRDDDVICSTDIRIKSEGFEEWNQNLDMKLKMLKKQKMIIETQRALLKETKKLKREVINEDTSYSSDSYDESDLIVRKQLKMLANIELDSRKKSRERSYSGDRNYSETRDRVHSREQRNTSYYKNRKIRSRSRGRSIRSHSKEYRRSSSDERNLRSRKSKHRSPSWELRYRPRSRAKTPQTNSRQRSIRRYDRSRSRSRNARRRLRSREVRSRSRSRTNRIKESRSAGLSRNTYSKISEGDFFRRLPPSNFDISIGSADNSHVGHQKSQPSMAELYDDIDSPDDNEQVNSPISETSINLALQLLDMLVEQSLARNVNLIAKEKNTLNNRLKAIVKARFKLLKLHPNMTLQDYLTHYRRQYTVADDKKLINKLIDELRTNVIELDDSDDELKTINPVVSISNCSAEQFEMQITPVLGPFEPVMKIDSGKPVVHEKKITSSPKFVIPIKNLLKQMKNPLSELDAGKDKAVLDALRDIFATKILELLSGKGYMTSKQILKLFREKYPIENDNEFLRSLISNIKKVSETASKDAKMTTEVNAIVDEVETNSSRVQPAEEDGTEILWELNSFGNSNENFTRSLQEKKMSSSRKFVTPVGMLLKEMKIVLKKMKINYDNVKLDILKNSLSSKILELITGKGNMSSKDIFTLFRKHYPVENDKEFLQSLLININNDSEKLVPESTKDNDMITQRNVIFSDNSSNTTVGPNNVEDTLRAILSDRDVQNVPVTRIEEVKSSICEEYSNNATANEVEDNLKKILSVNLNKAPANEIKDDLEKILSDNSNNALADKVEDNLEKILSGSDERNPPVIGFAETMSTSSHREDNSNNITAEANKVEDNLEKILSAPLVYKDNLSNTTAIANDVEYNLEKILSPNLPATTNEEDKSSLCKVGAGNLQDETIPMTTV